MDGERDFMQLSFPLSEVHDQLASSAVKDLLATMKDNLDHLQTSLDQLPIRNPIVSKRLHAESLEALRNELKWLAMAQGSKWSCLVRQLVVPPCGGTWLGVLTHPPAGQTPSRGGRRAYNTRSYDVPRLPRHLSRTQCVHCSCRACSKRVLLGPLAAVWQRPSVFHSCPKGAPICMWGSS